jgi:peptide/nickel transport system permease protein
MIRYIIRRLLWVALVLLIIVFLTYVIFFLLPAGDPAVRFAGKSRNPQVLASIRATFGLDRPWYLQYVRFTRNVFLGDQYGWPGLGISFSTREALKDIIFGRLLITMQLALGGAIVWLAVGIPIGILSALRPRSLMDRVAMGLAILGISMPVFFLGPLALYLFWFKLGWLPGTGYYPLGQYGFGQWFSHWILPWCVIAVLYAAYYARMSRANLMETMGEDYIRTARAKGISERRVVLKHGLRASLTPVVTIFGLDLAGLLGGAIITETVFNLPGIGQYTIISVGNLDLYAILDITVIAAFFVTMANLVVDVVYAFLDPRVRYT